MQQFNLLAEDHNMNMFM